MEIDNFDLIKPHLTFEPIEEKRLKKNGKRVTTTYYVDQYDVHILRRAKDCKKLANSLGSNESQRLLRTYEIKNIDYLDRKKEAIKELCRANNARAYILLQVRDARDYLLNIAQKAIEALMKRNYGVKAEHMTRTAFCEMHTSRDPVWMLDIDNDEMYGWTKDRIVDMLKANLDTCGRDPDRIWEVPTRNGFHIITEPFNTQLANQQCPMCFKDQSKGYRYEKTIEWFKANKPDADMSVVERLKENPFRIIEVEKLLGEDRKLVDSLRKDCKVDIVGWLHKDATTLLFAP